MITRVTGKNQITIPASLAREYGIEAGSRMDWLPGNKPNELRVQIQPAPRELLRCVREIGAKYASRTADSTKVISQMRHQDDAARMQALGRHPRTTGKRSATP